MVATNDIPDIMEGLAYDYKNNEGEWNIIVHLYFISAYVIGINHT